MNIPTPLTLLQMRNVAIPRATLADASLVVIDAQADYHSGRLPLSGIDVTLTMTDDGIDIEARVRTMAQTGVEMEALTAVAIAGLTVYDMVKAADKTMRLTDIRLMEKRGGQSGEYLAADVRSRTKKAAPRR